MLAHGRLFAAALSFASLAGFALYAPALLAQDAPKKDRATKDDYRIDTSGSSAEVTVGSNGVIKVMLTPRNGTKIHPQAPLEVKLSEPEGLKLDKRKLSRSDVENKEAKEPSLKTAITGNKAGTYNVDADVSFFLCTDEWCQRMTDRVSIAIKVKDKTS